MTLDKLKPSSIVLHLLARNGPQSGKQIAAYIPCFPQFKTKNYLKREILRNMKLRGELYKRKSTDPELTKLQKGESAYLWFIDEKKVDRNKYLNMRSLKNWNPDEKFTEYISASDSSSPENVMRTSSQRKDEDHRKRRDNRKSDVEKEEAYGVQPDSNYRGFDYYKTSNDTRWQSVQKLHWRLPENIRNITQEEHKKKT
ncbi:16279_t:CDS:1 [Acaulospora colombiana]|uniref:16279_t:CDS:1 n=1 Tax=Acaulospora colombiana TaxID=27376 RepID=A0ACA9MPI4_9GLOM|nr:16279_t:CDS:1 [Acaulospora colombiana]